MTPDTLIENNEDVNNAELSLLVAGFLTAVCVGIIIVSALFISLTKLHNSFSGNEAVSYETRK